ncbi:MAG: L-threonylcarbamoyladenylate synthase [Ekhidna sp.]
MAEIGIDLEKAISLLKANELVAIPTETVYGLAGNALQEEAILKIYEAKKRPKFDPLIAHTNSIESVDKLVNEIPQKARLLADAFWPGPLTMLLEKRENVPDLLTSGLNRVAVRIPKHPLAQELLSKLDFPLAAPSANPFGYVSPTSALHVQNQLRDQLQYILDGGECKVGIESTIIGFDNEKAIIHRLGGMSVENIEKVIGSVEIQTNNSSNPQAPGMLKSHYSPGRKVIIGDIATNLNKSSTDKVGVISFSESYNVKNEVILSPSRDLNEAAQNIFKALRAMDNSEVEVVFAEYLPDEGLGKAINDRLRRASV